MHIAIAARLPTTFHSQNTSKHCSSSACHLPLAILLIYYVLIDISFCLGTRSLELSAETASQIFSCLSLSPLKYLPEARPLQTAQHLPQHLFVWPQVCSRKCEVGILQFGEELLTSWQWWEEPKCKPNHIKYQDRFRQYLCWAWVKAYSNFHGVFAWYLSWLRRVLMSQVDQSRKCCRSSRIWAWNIFRRWSHAKPHAPVVALIGPFHDQIACQCAECLCVLIYSCISYFIASIRQFNSERSLQLIL